MNRIEFSQQLIVQRESAGIGKNELCRLTGFTFNQLQYLEKASNNYNINLVCTYLAAIKSKMVLLKGKKRKVICDFEGFADWMTSTRKLEYTQRALADKAGITYVTIANIESKKHIVRIDTLLKIVDVLGYTIKIENNEHFDPSSNREKRTVYPTISDEQICAKFREGENIYNIVNWYSNITGKGIEESKDIIVRLLFDRSDMGDYAKEVLLNTDYYNYIMEGITPSPESKSDKRWGWLFKFMGIVLASFVLFVIFLAIGNAGIANVLFFIFVLGGSYSIVWGMSERNNARIFGYIMSLIITIIALCAIWNAAFNWES